jgi:hypothetical protein
MQAPLKMSLREVSAVGFSMDAPRICWVCLRPGRAYCRTVEDSLIWTSPVWTPTPSESAAASSRRLAIAVSAALQRRWMSRAAVIAASVWRSILIGKLKIVIRPSPIVVDDAVVLPDPLSALILEGADDITKLNRVHPFGEAGITANVGE